MVFGLLFCLWLLFRLAYLRTGSGIKIAIAYDGHRVPMDDWIRTRRHFSDLLQQGQISQEVSIRLVDPALANSDSRVDHLYKKYKFRAVVLASVSLKAADPSKPSTSLKFTAKHGAGGHEFHEATVRHLNAIALSRPPVVDVHDLIKRNAETLFESLLMLVGACALADNRLAEASGLLTALDTHIAARFKKSEFPRNAIRWWDCSARMRRGNFENTAIPSPDEIADALRYGAAAVERYLDEFPAVGNVQARHLFFAGQLDEALQLTERVIALPMKPSERARANLNHAVLSLFKSNYRNCYESFQRLFNDDLGMLPWEDLVNFADTAREMGQPGAVYLCGLYRMVTKKQVPPELAVAVKAWLDEDASRKDLVKLYARAQRLGAPQAASPKPRTKAKKRSRDR